MMLLLVFVSMLTRKVTHIYPDSTDSRRGKTIREEQ